MNARRLFARRWLMISVVVVGVICGLSFEGLWQFKIKRGTEQIVVSRWLTHSKDLEAFVGSINSVELERVRSTYSYGLHDDSSGRYHYSVIGTRSKMDVLVSWHEEPQSHAVVIDLVQPYGETFSSPIWRNLPGN